MRIGSAATHTYTTIVERSRGAFDFGNYPLCVVGDTRCAKYYVWP